MAAPKTLYLYGRTGCGKTTSAHKALHETKTPHYWKAPTGKRGWTGYEGQTTIIMDNWDDGSYNMNTMLNLLDDTPFVYKRETTLNATHFLILTWTHPETLYRHCKKKSPEAWKKFQDLVQNHEDITTLTHEQLEGKIKTFLTT